MLIAWYRDINLDFCYMLQNSLFVQVEFTLKLTPGSAIRGSISLSTAWVTSFTGLTIMRLYWAWLKVKTIFFVLSF